VLLDRVRSRAAPDFVRERLSDLDSLIAMLEDREWDLEGEDREIVVGALGYFADPREAPANDLAHAREAKGGPDRASAHPGTAFAALPVAGCKALITRRAAGALRR
jgi:hypothetical protein